VLTLIVGILLALCGAVGLRINGTPNFPVGLEGDKIRLEHVYHDRQTMTEQLYAR
jgi:hypothetical protein